MNTYLQISDTDEDRFADGLPSKNFRVGGNEVDCEIYCLANLTNPLLPQIRQTGPAVWQHGPMNMFNFILYFVFQPPLSIFSRPSVVIQPRVLQTWRLASLDLMLGLLSGFQKLGSSCAAQWSQGFANLIVAFTVNNQTFAEETLLGACCFLWLKYGIECLCTSCKFEA